MAFCSQCGHENPDGVGFCASCGQASQPDAVVAPTSGSGSGRSLRVWVFAALGVVVVFVALVAVTTFLRVSGLTRNAVIGVVPADAEMYVEIDLLEVSEENLQVLIDAFSDPLADQGVDVEEVDDIFTVFDDIFDDEFRLTVEDDVMPWVGRHIGAAVFDTIPSTSDYDAGGYGYVEDWLTAWAIPWGDAEGDTLVVVQVREPDLADRFLEDLADAFDDQGWPVDDRTIEGLDFYEVSYQFDYEFVGDLVFGRSDDVVLLAGSTRLVKQALRTQAGDQQSIAEFEGFGTAMRDLPQDAFIRGYWSQTGVKDFTESYGKLAELDRRSSEAFGAVGAAGWFTDSGFRTVSSVDVDTEKLPEDALQWLEELGSTDSLAMMPEGRSAYYAVPGYNLLLNAYCDATGDEWYCDEGRDFRSFVSVGASTLSGDAYRSLEMATFADADAARRFMEDDVASYDDAEKVLDQAGNALWTVERPDTIWYRAGAATGSTGWSWSNRSETEEQRTDDAIDEFELIVNQPRLKVPANATASLRAGTVPLSFIDAVVLVKNLDASENDYDRDEADLYRPFQWIIAGLQWDGDRLHASAAIEWQP